MFAIPTVHFLRQKHVRPSFAIAVRWLGKSRGRWCSGTSRLCTLVLVFGELLQFGRLRRSDCLLLGPRLLDVLDDLPDEPCPQEEPRVPLSG